MKVGKHVLVTGFEPFGGASVNPSELVVRSLEGRHIAGRSLVTHVLPVETGSLDRRLAKILDDTQPDVVIGLGQAAGRSALAIERVAVNILDFKKPDNAGAMRSGEPIAPGGPDARLSNLPFDSIVTSWHESGVPGYVSNSAGTYICNQLLYEALAQTQNAASPVLVGFVHLPYLPAQAIATGSESTPSMSLDLMKRGIELLIETIVPRIEHRTPEALARPKRHAMWIPRGVKEAER